MRRAEVLNPHPRPGNTSILVIRANKSSKTSISSVF